MANQRVQHRFVISHAPDKQAAYLLSWTSEWYAPGEIDDKDGVGSFTAWTTLDAAKREARVLSSRSRLSWVRESDEYGEIWSATSVQIIREGS